MGSHSFGNYSKTDKLFYFSPSNFIAEIETYQWERVLKGLYKKYRSKRIVWINKRKFTTSE